MSISLNGDGIISGVSSITVGAGASVFSPAANTLALGTNGSERVRVESDGDFLAKPNNSFDIQATTSGVSLRLQTTGTGTAITDGCLLQMAGDSKVYLYNKENASLVFGANDAEKARILPGGGLTFNGDTAAANALDDYEEGTWTPAISYSTSNGDLSYTVQYGSYVKVGRLCHCYFYVWFSESTASGNVEIAGQPFTLSTTGLYGGTSTNLILRENGTPYILQNNYLLRKTDGSILTAADTGSNTVYVGSFTYLTT